LTFERRAQLPLAHDHESSVGHLAHHERRSVYQISVAFLLGQRSDRAHDGRARRQPELSVNVCGGLDLHAMQIDPFVHGDDAIAIDAIADEHGANRVGRGDEAVDLVILPA
jgi:hypothetical protein